VGRHFVAEEVRYPRPMTKNHRFIAAITNDGRYIPVRVNESKLRSIGTEAFEAIDATATVAYSDLDGDGLDDTFTITLTTDLTDLSEVAVYFAEDDRLRGEGLSERWRIAPISLSLNAGTLTISGNKWHMIKPIKYEGFGVTGLDASDSNNFVTQAAVYRRYSSSAGITTDDAQAVLVWEAPPWPQFCETTTVTIGTDPAAVGYAIARASISDAAIGEVLVGGATYNSDDSTWSPINLFGCRQPDRVIVRYEAGSPLSYVENTLNKSGYVGHWDEIVARFAAAQLNRPVCACQHANSELYRWQFDMSRAAGANDEQYRIDDRALANPFGTRAGEIQAWRAVANMMTVRSSLI